MRVQHLFAAAALAVAATAADAAFIKDATFDLSGNYAYNPSTANVDFSGGFGAALLGDPTVARDYVLTIEAALNGAELINEALPLAGFVGFPFSLEDAAVEVGTFIDGAFGLGNVISFLDGITSNVQFTSNGIEGDFGFSAPANDVAGFFQSFCSLFTTCPNVGSTGDFTLALGLGYDDIAPIPLPAALPLLAAGVGGLVAFGRRRARA